MLYKKKPTVIVKKSMSEGVGRGGGNCRCPDGKIHPAGATFTSKCKTLACVGGTALSCTRLRMGKVKPFSFMHVTCGVNFLFQSFIYY